MSDRHTPSGTTVYCVSHSEGLFYVPTLAEAMAIAREESAAEDLYIRVTKHRVTTRLGKRALYCALLNGAAWADASEATR
jgi:hypothetical protein